MTMIWPTVSKLWFSLVQKKHKHRWSTQIHYRNYYSCSTQGWLLKAQTLSPHSMHTATGNYLFLERLLTVCSLSMKYLQRSSHSHTEEFNTIRSYHQIINNWYIKDDNKCLCSGQKTIEEEKKILTCFFSFFL